jgi:CheY-like chemotaxis protein
MSDIAPSLTPRILIVDDDGALRKLLQATLKYGQYQLYEATNGTEAISLALELMPQVIVLDVMMPGDINGLEVCKRIKETPRLQHIYIVLLSALNHESDRLAGERVQADAYLSKPFSPLELLDLIEMHLDINKRS